ncbi:MAG: alpha-amylase family glycosyl hydrolase, partial [Candidatus Acidiferrum sp.]
MTPVFPSLYQVNTRIYLGERASALGRSATFDDWPDAELDRNAKSGFDWLWPLGVWRTGTLGQNVARTALDWAPIRAALPDFTDQD